MSQENVELVHLLIEALNRRDLDAALALMDDDVEVASRIVVIEGGLRGHDGVRHWVAELVRHLARPQGRDCRRQIDPCHLRRVAAAIALA